MGGTRTGEQPYFLKIHDILQLMEVGDQYCKTELIKSLLMDKYSEKDIWFQTRSFDVIFCTAKRMIPDKKFVSVNKKITRLL